jgi:hypothetical protein
MYARVPSRATRGLARRGARRTHGTALAQKILAVLADLRAMLATCPNNLIGTRDRAILLLGFAGALDVADLAFGELGMTVTAAARQAIGSARVPRSGYLSGGVR